MTSPALLTAEELCRSHRSRPALVSPAREVRALDRVSFTLAPGERLGVVGESGSGKSSLVRVILALERPDSGEVRFGPDQRPVRAGSARRTRWFRSRVQFVPQDPGSSFNPRLRVGESIAEPLVCLNVGTDHGSRVAEVLTAVGLDPDMARRFPGEFSGGQRQRLAIARALAPEPSLLVADEPVSALDVSSRTRVIELLKGLSLARGLALVLVSHDLGVVRALCDQVLILHEGRVVEQGAAAEVLTCPNEEHTRRLVDAVPRLPTPEPVHGPGARATQNDTTR
ncbi:ABC transporter ATP-binding protein [Nocardiopsis nanhaiensis]